MNRRKHAALFFGALAIAWIGVLFFFSGQDAAQSGSLSLKVARKLLEWLPWIDMPLDAFHHLLRKLAHAGIFGVEGLFTGLCLLNILPLKLGAALSMIACGIMAAANEYHQTFIDGRVGQISDVVIDSAGALLGIIAAAVLIAIARIPERLKNKIKQDR